jgi:hypothetical protein
MGTPLALWAIAAGPRPPARRGHPRGSLAVPDRHSIDVIRRTLFRRSTIMRLDILPSRRGTPVSVIAAALTLAVPAWAVVQDGSDDQPTLQWAIVTQDDTIRSLIDGGTVTVQASDSIGVLLTASAPGGIKRVTLKGKRKWCGATTAYTPRSHSPAEPSTFDTVELDGALAGLESCPIGKPLSITLTGTAYNLAGNHRSREITIKLNTPNLLLGQP